MILRETFPFNFSLSVINSQDLAFKLLKEEEIYPESELSTILAKKLLQAWKAVETLLGCD